MTASLLNITATVALISTVFALPAISGPSALQIDKSMWRGGVTGDASPNGKLETRRHSAVESGVVPTPVKPPAAPAVRLGPPPLYQSPSASVKKNPPAQTGSLSTVKPLPPRKMTIKTQQVPPTRDSRRNRSNHTESRKFSDDRESSVPALQISLIDDLLKSGYPKLAAELLQAGWAEALLSNDREWIETADELMTELCGR